jgi:hypothetical protein
MCVPSIIFVIESISKFAVLKLARRHCCDSERPDHVSFLTRDVDLISKSSTFHARWRPRE